MKTSKSQGLKPGKKHIKFESSVH